MERTLNAVISLGLTYFKGILKRLFELILLSSPRWGAAMTVTGNLPPPRHRPRISLGQKRHKLDVKAKHFLIE
jgi:hypothetical protein